MVERSALMMNDATYAIGDLMQESDKGFSLREEARRFLPYVQPFQNAITFEVSLTRSLYQRTVYSAMDLLSDIGGLFGALKPICFTLVLVFQYYGAYSFVMSDLSRDRNSEAREAAGDGFSQRRKEQPAGRIEKMKHV